MVNLVSKRRLYCAVTIIAFGVLWLRSGFADTASANTSAVIQRLLPSVVNITVQRQVATTEVGDARIASGSDNPTSKTSVGSGFVIDTSGLIVTNYHVVEGAFSVTVILSDGTALPGTLLQASKLADIAVVQVHADRPLMVAHWGDSTRLAVGDQVFAIGNPLGIGTSVSAGIVSGLNRDVQASPYDAYIQTDAAINHGNSGGPLFDAQGQVVGVNTALLSPTEASAGLGLAIPSASALFVVEQLLKYGWVRPGWMGIKIQQITPEMADALRAKKVEGSIVSWVLPDSPAGQAGIAVGDVILRYGDDAPRDERALLRDIAHTPLGSVVNVELLRDGVPRRVAVTIAAWPRSLWDKRDTLTSPDRPKLSIRSDLGLSLASVPADQRASLDLGSEPGGVQITSVLPGSDAARRGTAVGDVILRVQDKIVGKPEDVWAGIKAARAAQRRFVMILVLPKVRKDPGPQWRVLQIAETTD